MKQIVFLVILLFSLQLKGQTIEEVNELVYRVLSDSSVSLVGCPKNISAVTIPKSVKINKKVYKVTNIESTAFAYNTKINIINLPSTITKIDESAFAGCSSLLTMIIPKSIRKIEDGTFFNCSSLQGVEMSNTVESIGNWAFAGCKFLMSDYFSMPTSLKKIGNRAFNNCGINFKSAEFHNSLDTIGTNAFEDCKYLTSVTIPNTIQCIGYGAFDGCSSLQKVEITNTNTNGFNNGIIKDFAFNGCESLINVSIPSSIKNIGSSAFQNCKLINNIIIPESVTNIGCNAFFGCKSISHLSIPNSVITIGEKAFVGCESLSELSISNSLTTINNSVFFGCSSLRNVSIPNSVKSIGEEAFRFCTSLQNVYIPNSVTSIGESAFINCDLSKQTQKSIDDIYNSFSNYAYNQVSKFITEWQKKKEFETTSQWKLRVTEESRKQQISQILEKVKQDYIKEHTPKKTEWILGSYDADNTVYSIGLNNLKSIYLNVPINDAPAFKNQWKSVVITPKYGIIDNQLGVVSCIAKLENKSYQSIHKQVDNSISDLAINLPPLEIDLSGSTGKTQEATPLVTDNDVDLNIPSTSTINSKTFAVVIGNENYQRTAKVAYAVNDAKVFAGYCQKTLGLPASNVRLYKDATYGSMLAAVKDIQSIADAYHGEINVIFYYAGHGIPAENTKEAYLLPVDADGTQPEVCYPLSLLYKKLEGLNAKSTLVFMDACFSGAQRGESMLASARGVVIKVKQDAPQGNMVIFSAAQGDETAYPYKEKGHGLFTYFLLKKLQETKGAVTLGDLSNYVTTNVSQQSIVVNRKSQTPTVVPSANIGDGWKSVVLK